MHLPPPPGAPTAAGRPCHGCHPPHRKNRERRRRRGVKRRREREKKERCASITHTAASVRVRAERDGRRQSGTAAPITITWRAATALPTAAARATTRPLHHAARSCATDSAPQSIFAPPRLAADADASAARAPDCRLRLRLRTAVHLRPVGLSALNMLL